MKLNVTLESSQNVNGKKYRRNKKKMETKTEIKFYRMKLKGPSFHFATLLLFAFEKVQCKFAFSFFNH